MNKILNSHPDLIKKFGYLILGLVVFIIFLIDYFLLLRPQVKALSSLGTKISGFSKDIKETRLNIGKIDSLKAEAVLLKEKLGKAEKGILPTNDVAAISDHFSKIAAQCGVQINQITPLQESEAAAFKPDRGDYVGFPVSVEAEGGYHNIGVFFQKIENNEILMNIQNFQISQNVRSLKKHLLKMVVMVFILKKDQK